MKDAHPGMAILALAIVSQSGPENLPNDIPDEHEEEFPENTPDQQPEIDQDDFGADEEIESGAEEEEPEIPDHDDLDETAI